MLYQTFFINRRVLRDGDMETIKVSLLPLGSPFASPSSDAALTAANLTYPTFRPHLCIGEHDAD